ncbi:MAG: nitrogen fixation negative regulator NifL [Gammaproteobacteria bacterium]|nr:MAG: nitrogen fixation negative regulator NifL [Gammaproteobacteria bacterium]
MPDKCANTVYGEVIDAINRLFAAPSQGAPSDLIRAFGLIKGTSGLPPRIFLETVEQAPVAISITDQSARILYVNAAFERLTGYALDEVIGAKASVLSSKSTPLSVYEALWTTIQDNRVWRGTLVNHRKNGEEYLADLTISPVLNDEGGTSCFLAMHSDITEVHSLQRQLEFQMRLTEAALDAAPMVVAMIDGKGNLILDNAAYKALSADFSGKHLVDLFMQALQHQIGFEMGDVCESQDGFTNIDVRLDCPVTHSPRWFSCSGVRVADFNGEARSFFDLTNPARCCLLLIANEVTGSRERINDARMNMIRSNMAEQQIMQVMQESMCATMFKLQVPINIVRAALSMVTADSPYAGMRPVLQQALESGEEAMQSLSRSMPSPRVEESSSINVNELLQEVLRLTTDNLLAAGIVVDWRAAPVLPSLVGRPNALRGLFKYLLDNAVQALIESRQDCREIRIETREDAGDVVVAVMDNGLGIKKADWIRVFEPFYCGWRHTRHHAGMGLTMAQEVAIRHGGAVEIDTGFLGGCRFFVRLPTKSREGPDHDPR